MYNNGIKITRVTKECLFSGSLEVLNLKTTRPAFKTLYVLFKSCEFASLFIAVCAAETPPFFARQIFASTCRKRARKVVFVEGLSKNVAVIKKANIGWLCLMLELLCFEDSDVC